MDELELRHMRATYYGLITQVDDQIGRIVAHLKETGEYDHTLIVFTCDHAEMLGDHYAWSKELYFDQSFRIPLINRDPRPKANATRGRTFDAFTEAIDIMPTILDWLSLDAPQQCDGHSLLPFKTSMLNAAYANGTMAHALDWDNTWYPLNHPTSPTLPAILAIAEHRGLGSKAVSEDGSA